MFLVECMYILYNIEMIMLTAKMMWVLLTREVENNLGDVRSCNKKVVGESSYIMINYGKTLSKEQSDRNIDR